MASLICNGWRIFFYPLFSEQWVELRNKVKDLKSKLPKKEFIEHEEVKLLKALNVGIKEKITQDPFATHFILQKPLQKYGRLKKMGLPERYRLFFRAFKEEKIIVIFWLGYPRKADDKKDCYKVFTKKVKRGEFPTSLNELLAECESDSSNGDED